MKVNESLIRVDNLTPLTEYEFQMKICHTASELTRTNAASLMDRNALLCSKWSPSVRNKSSGKGKLTVFNLSCDSWNLNVKMSSIIQSLQLIVHDRSSAPSQQLHVWRKVDGQGENGRLNLTVFWKVKRHCRAVIVLNHRTIIFSDQL